ncbi:glycosyl hydrolase family 115 (putative glucuronidase) [Novosphingobium sp. PhB57]|uniref:glycosyl hydrolase 115 family protein n=1 Tax=Novosphingobium sp. PhB57 TaxID=2485107 RepID=UPI001053B4C3|nr:glycosyl hydrolase 115 family protein [Novosphingobium sp. PhB57]TCU57410.1 glycosyl hydrolase family 115 (putative glucuronidase) [Novosphingobium sp. PhB57]
MRGAAFLAVAAGLVLAHPAQAAAPEFVHFTPARGDFALAQDGHVAQVVTSAGDHELVRIAAEDLRTDLATVTGANAASDVQVWIGTLGRNPAIDRLVAAGRVDAAKLRGAWESFLIVPVSNPAPGVKQALVIVGSDRRGTAYGAYEISRAIGVSPWHWWADVPPQHHGSLYVSAKARRFGPPSVQYRGIFINDEDWGLVPWAQGAEPDEPAPGPKTYAKVFDLLLRLRANTLWPAMHKASRAFNADPANAALAERYGVVMGTSHAEPMLRNNVGEWTGKAEDFNYLTNRDAMRDYWRTRVKSNAADETIWTLGLRGIHDSGMIGPTTDPERRAVLEQVFADQRELLREAGISGAPQVFTPYKEVLDIYRAGLKVPDDVTLMWTDDNFGYIRHLPDAAERARSGGNGVYYHLSYLGAPLSYLWLSTTPPALIREEMGRAWDKGARKMWIVNVGDIKPAELGIDYFLSLAWDIERTRTQPVETWMGHWLADILGTGQGRGAAAGTDPQAAAVMSDYYRLNFARRPEHLQWYLPGQKPHASPLTTAEADARLAGFAAMEQRLAALRQQVPAGRADAFFELLDYPVSASAAANRRFFAAEAHDALRDTAPAESWRRARIAAEADAALTALTRRYNRDTAGGKWRGIMNVEPADGQWRSFRQTPPVVPALAALPDIAAPAPEPEPRSALPLLRPEQFTRRPSPNGPSPHGNSPQGSAWRLVEGLGRYGALLGAGGASASAQAAITLPAGRWQAVVDLLPAYPSDNGEALRLTIRIDGKPQVLEIPRRAGDRDWADAVLDNRISVPFSALLEAGQHKVTIESGDPAVMIEAVRFMPADKSITPT